MREPQMSGHCAFPQTAHPEESHLRCASNGGGNKANPYREFQPCPCSCHYPGEHYECECGGVLVETNWPDEFAEEEDREPEVVFSHLDPETGRATGFACNGKRGSQEIVSGNENDPDDISAMLAELEAMSDEV